MEGQSPLGGAVGIVAQAERSAKTASSALSEKGLGPRASGLGLERRSFFFA
jgi:hypothetical protein